MATPERPPRDRKELYERIAQGGKADVIFEEMVRLGFWQGAATFNDPVDEIRRKTELRERLATLRTQAARLRNLAQLEADLKKQRMAESKRRREETKQKRLGERAASREQTKQTKTRE